MTKRIQFHPVEKEIARYLDGRVLAVTPSQIAQAIGVHPRTVQRRIRGKLRKFRLITVEKRGNREYIKINHDGWDKVDVV